MSISNCRYCVHENFLAWWTKIVLLLRHSKNTCVLHLYNFYFWPLECCFAVWSSGWSTAERSIVNYASTDLLSRQVSTPVTRMVHPLWFIWLSQQLLRPYEFSSISLQLVFHHNCFLWSIKNSKQRLQLVVNLSFFSLLPGHALTSAHPGHLCWPTHQCGNSHPLLVPLHAGGLRMARGGSSHSV